MVAFQKEMKSKREEEKQNERYGDKRRSQRKNEKIGRV